MCSREVVSSSNMTASRLVELEQSTAILHQELARLRLENSEVGRLRKENMRLQERNLQLAAELAVKTQELSRQQGEGDVLVGESRMGLSRQQSTGGMTDNSDTSDLPNAVPGDSFPGVATSLDIIDCDTTDGETETEEVANHKVIVTGKTENERLLQRLHKGGDRMEQIKRQLVVQRGAIVAALKLFAENRTQASSLKIEEEGEVSVTEERDRGVGSITSMQGDRVVEGEGKLCPMCEARFPWNVSTEQFEQHVMDHFCWEDGDQETLQYYQTQGEPGEL